MKLPISWLKEYVEIDCSTDELVKKLFSCGFEVEEIVETGKNIDKIVTCKIVEIEKHPNADKLSVTKVDAGKYGTLQIITSAKNIFVGAVVPVAIDGSTLNNGEKIVAGELRGLPSYGMFCSGEELGINDDWYSGASVNGILILDEKMPLGESVKDLLNIGDVILDINVTANRPDCQSVLGLAREVAAVLNKPLKMPDLSFGVNKNVSTLNTVTVKNKAFDLCPRYKARLVKNVKIAESPLWLKRRLFLMGLRSINNVVDITNYVLLEIGQPMHAFDVKTLGGNEIIVRRAENGEKITTLDEKVFSLNDSNLVIADAEKPVALAGVMGGLNSEIEGDTENVLFEAATFKRDNVRKTSRALGQRSDSSARFEKGVDLWSVETGLKRALHLIDELGCGEIAADEYDLHEAEIKEKYINTTVEKVNGVLGIDIPVTEIEDVLKRLTFDVKTKDGNLTVKVPLYREDMEDYPDIAEEIIREHGYDHIESTLLKTSQITAGGLNENQKKTAALKNLLVGYGFNEIITYSFVSEKEFDLYGLDKSKAIKLLNPISEDMAVMRTSVLPSVVRAAIYNLKRKNYEGRLFELAKTYIAEKLPLEKLPDEKTALAFTIFGKNEDFFTAKGVVEGLIENFCFGITADYKVSEKKFMHPTRSADVFVGGKNIGFFGQLNPELVEKLGVEGAIYVGEIDYDLFATEFNDKIVFKPLSKYPVVERDLAVVVNDAVSCESVIQAIRKGGGSLLDGVKLFDVYKGSNVPVGKKSLAFNLTFLSYERTLNVEEVDETVKNILNELRKTLGAELR